MLGAMIRTLLIAAALLGACKKSSTPDCDGAGKAVETAAADVVANAKDDLTRETAKRVGPGLAANIVLRCKEDKWSAAATDCVKKAKGGNFRECESTLTKEQSTKLYTGVAAIESTAPAPAATDTTAPTPGGPAPDCAAMEGVMTKAWSGQVSAAQNDADRKAAEAMRLRARSEVTKRCTDDKWTAAATDCFKSVTNGDFAACKAMLTPMQASAVDKMVPASTAPAAAPTAPAIPSEGSAEGAAEGGSATP